MMKQPDCRLCTINASRFTWTGKTGCADASDLTDLTVRRIWSDACDSGFRVRSDRTGREIVFTVLRADRDGWLFVDIHDMGLLISINND